jgi:environmental stress-induced protein Ves
MLRILRSAEYPARPWKNGGGTTREISVFPPGASLDDFHWRVSLAQVERDGPFSRFDDVDRTLVLLSGAMTLHEQDRRIELVCGEPVTFAGERVMNTTLRGGSTLDLNVMTRRGRAQHTVRRDIFGARTTLASSTGGMLLVFALERGLTVDGEQLKMHDTAVSDARQIVVAAPAGTAAALVIQIVDFRPNVL